MKESCCFCVQLVQCCTRVLSTHFEQNTLLGAVEDVKLKELHADHVLNRGARKARKGLSWDE